MTKRTDLDEFDSRVSKAGHVIALVSLVAFAAVMCFRVVIPILTEMGDAGKVAAVFAFALFVVGLAYAVVVCRRLLFPARKKEEPKREDAE